MTTPARHLIHERCWHHSSREAAVRCPECRRFYCRECVTEHQGRMVCAACVARLAGRAAVDASGLHRLAWIAAAVGGLLLAWAVFYYLGVMLARIPSDFFGGSS
ncbi:MAG: rhomboid family protein [Bryobacteraceae bacterium]